MDAVLIAYATVIVTNLIWRIYHRKSIKDLTRENKLLKETYINYHKRAFAEKADAYTLGYHAGYQDCESEEDGADDWVGVDLDGLLKEWKADPEKTINIYPFENRPWGKN